MFTSVAALPQAAPQPSSVVYPPGQVQPVPEIMEQSNQLKFVVSDLKFGFSDLKMSHNETRLDRGKFIEHLAKNDRGKKKPKKNKGLCMQSTMLAFVILIIGVVLGSYLTDGLSKN
jgi:hypothetical protein